MGFLWGYAPHPYNLLILRRIFEKKGGQIMCDIQNWNSYIKSGIRSAKGCDDNYKIACVEGGKLELRSVNNGVLAQSDTLNRAQSEDILDYISDYSKAKSTGALILLYDQLLPACAGGLTLFEKKLPRISYKQDMSIDGHDYLVHYSYKVTVNSGLAVTITAFDGPAPYCRVDDNIEIKDQYSGLLAHKMLTAKLIHDVREMREAETDKSEEFIKLCRYVGENFRGRNTEEVFEKFAKFVNSDECSKNYTLKFEGDYITLYDADRPLKVFYNPDKYDLIRGMYIYVWLRRDLLHVHSRLDSVPHEFDLDNSVLRFRDKITIDGKPKQLLVTAQFNGWDRDITVTVSEPDLTQVQLRNTKFRHNEAWCDYGCQPDRVVGFGLAIVKTIENIGDANGEIINKLKGLYRG